MKVKGILSTYLLRSFIPLSLRLSEKDILALAPSVKIANSGKQFSSPFKWLNLFTNGNLLWGECKASNSESYYTTWVDLLSKSFKCTCPSRKKPCKHAIGLSLIQAYGGEGFLVQDPPKNLIEWAERYRNPTEEDLLFLKQKETETELRRQLTFDKRIESIAGGLQDLETWLEDVIQQGVASLEKDAFTICEQIAKRMSDAKMQSIGERIREIPLLIRSRPNWTEKVAFVLGELHLFLQGFHRYAELSPELQAQLNQVAGIKINKEALKESGTTLQDEWLILGSVEGNDPVNPRLYFRRVWLWGIQLKRAAMILDYNFGSSNFEGHFPEGNKINAALTFYPGSLPVRAVVYSRAESETPFESLPGFNDLSEFMEAYAQAIALNPWLTDFPCVLSNVIPIMIKGELWVVDALGQRISIEDDQLTGWKLIALSGGKNIDVFGEWTGDKLVPLSVFLNGRFVKLSY